MRYTVLWSPDAENDLAAIWLDANDRSAVTAAGNQIDASLWGPSLWGQTVISD